MDDFSISILNLHLNRQEINQICGVILSFVFVIFLPTILLVTGWRVLKKANEVWLNQRYNVNEMIELFKKVDFTVREVLEVLIIVTAVSYVNHITGLFPEVILELGLTCVLLYHRYKENRTKLSEDAESVVTNINKMISGISDAKFHLEQLSRIISNKDNELSEKQKLAEQFEDIINKKEKEAKSWERLTDEQKYNLAEMFTSLQPSETFLKKTKFIVVTLVLNIIATAIWTLFGSPGKQDILKIISPFH